MVNNSDNKTYLIGQIYQIMVFGMLQIWNNRYSSHYRIIKYLGFEPIIYVINLNIALFSKVLNEFNSIFLLNVLLVSNLNQ